MFSMGANILIVESQQEILNMMRLAMMSFRIYEQPINLLSVSDVEEAAILLDAKLSTRQGINMITVALIALDGAIPRAGLELCRFIREDLHNQEIQIYLRIDNTGAVPGRDYFDRYSISGYFTTAEIAEDRLYAMVKNGVHYGRTLARIRVFIQLLEVLSVTRSRAGIKTALNQLITQLEVDNTGQAHNGSDPRIVFLFDGEIVAKHRSLQDADILAHWLALRQETGIRLSEDGDKYAVNTHHFLLHICKQATCAEFSYLCPLTGEKPDKFAVDFYRFARLAATLWKYAE